MTDYKAVIASIQYSIHCDADWVYRIRDEEGIVWFSSDYEMDAVSEYYDKYITQEQAEALKLEADIWNDEQDEQAANGLLSYTA
jgi:hypothetical protein